MLVVRGRRNRASEKAASVGSHGKIGYILAWLLGIPIPILIVIILLRGCN